MYRVILLNTFSELEKLFSKDVERIISAYCIKEQQRLVRVNTRGYFSLSLKPRNHRVISCVCEEVVQARSRLRNVKEEFPLRLINNGVFLITLGRFSHVIRKRDGKVQKLSKISGKGIEVS